MPEILLSPAYGLSKNQLKKTTATVSDVISGKRFYDANGSLATGTLVEHPAWVQSVDTPYMYEGVLCVNFPLGAYRTKASGQTGSQVQVAQSKVASAIGLNASHLVSWVNVLGIQGTNRGYDVGWTDGINSSKIYRESGWVFQVRDDPNLKGRPFKVRVQTNGNSQPTISLGFDNGTIINL